jgi:hypothetical protein
MFLRITRGSYLLETEADVTRIVEELLVPAMRELPGFQHYYGGVNRATGAIVAVSLWDTEDHANFPREALAGTVPALLGKGVRLELAEIYDVLVDA